MLMMSWCSPPEHIDYLKLVVERLQDAGLKLKLAKSHFICKEVEYLGNILTRSPQIVKFRDK